MKGALDGAVPCRCDSGDTRFRETRDLVHHRDTRSDGSKELTIEDRTLDDIVRFTLTGWSKGGGIIGGFLSTIRHSATPRYHASPDKTAAVHNYLPSINHPTGVIGPSETGPLK